MSMESLLTKNKLFKAEITKKLNKMIDIPWLDERIEGQIIAQLVNSCMNALLGKKGGGGGTSAAAKPTTGKKRGIGGTVGDEGEVDLEAELVIPEEGDEDADEIAKSEMVDRINERFDVPGMSEEREAKFIRYFVDVLFKIKRHKE